MQFRKDIPEGNGGGKNFLKLKDKESVTGIFRGDPNEFYVIWDNGKSRNAGEEEDGAKFRFRVNFVVKEGSVYVPKIFEQGLTVYRQLSELHDEYDLETTVVKITRNGTGTDTTYSLLPLLKQSLTKEVVSHLDTLELHELGPKKIKNHAPGADNEEIPF